MGRFGSLIVSMLLCAATLLAQCPALVDAAAKGDTVATTSLLAAGADPNCVANLNVKGWTPLMAAAKTGSTEVAKALLKAGANVNAKNEYGATAFDIAALHGYSSDIAVAISTSGGKGRENSLSFALSIPSIDAEPSGDPDDSQFDALRFSVFHASAFMHLTSAKVDVSRQFVSARYEVINLTYYGRNDGTRTISGEIVSARIVWQHGMSVSQQWRSEFPATFTSPPTTFFKAPVSTDALISKFLSGVGCLGECRTLLDQQLALWERGDEHTLETVALTAHDVGLRWRSVSRITAQDVLAKFALEDKDSYIRLTAVGRLNEVTALNGAARKPADVTVFDRLIRDKNKAVRREANVGMTFCAAQNGDMTRLKAALKTDEWLAHGPNKPGTLTPLHVAAANGQKEVVELLLSYAVHVNAFDSNRQTALHFAAANGHRDVVELLIAHGAEINALSLNGATPFAAAVDRRHAEIAALLAQYGGHN